MTAFLQALGDMTVTIARPMHQVLGPVVLASEDRETQKNDEDPGAATVATQVVTIANVGPTVTLSVAC